MFLSPSSRLPLLLTRRKTLSRGKRNKLFVSFLRPAEPPRLFRELNFALSIMPPIGEADHSGQCHLRHTSAELFADAEAMT